MYCLRKMHLWGSKLHVVYSIPRCVYLGWSAYLGTMSKIRVWPYYNGYMTGAATGWEWFQYIILTPCLWLDSKFAIKKHVFTATCCHNFI